MPKFEEILEAEEIPEAENVMMKFIQIRDEIKESLNNEIDKIPASIKTLESTTTKFIAHFDDFKKLSSEASKQMAESVKEAGVLAGQLAAKDLVNLVKNNTQNIVNDEIKRFQREIEISMGNLRQSIGTADQVLRNRQIALTRTGYVATFSFCLAALLVAWGIHHFFPQSAHYHLNPVMAKTYFVGERILDNWEKLSEKEKTRLTALINNIDSKK